MTPYLFNYNVPHDNDHFGKHDLFLQIKARYITSFTNGDMSVSCELVSPNTFDLARIKNFQLVNIQIQIIAKEYFEEKLKAAA